MIFSTEKTLILADHIPLKQGLRQRNGGDWFLIKEMARRPYSIKTRIKTRCPFRTMDEDVLADHIPLKQGLRQIHRDHLEREGVLADHIPLKQGLRPNQIWASNPNSPVSLADHIPLKQGLRQCTI